MNITLQQLATLDAIIEHGSIQAGAEFLNKTHPSIITAIKKLEGELGFSIFDRSGYRSTLTLEGVAFYKSAKQILNDVNRLKTQALHLGNNEEAELNIAIGDITPIPGSLKVLHQFSEQNRFTHLNLLFENLEGVNERLLNEEADLIIHHIDKTDHQYEYKDFCKVQVIPVVAKDFLSLPVNNNLRYADLENYTQCIIRDTTSNSETKNHFVLEQSPHITVGDQHTKKEIIMQRMAWGHMPLFLIKNELKSGKLISIAGKHIKGRTVDIVVSRLLKKRHGIMAERLWQTFK